MKIFFFALDETEGLTVDNVQAGEDLFPTILSGGLANDNTQDREGFTTKDGD